MLGFIALENLEGSLWLKQNNISTGVYNVFRWVWTQLFQGEASKRSSVWCGLYTDVGSTIVEDLQSCPSLIDFLRSRIDSVSG